MAKISINGERASAGGFTPRRSRSPSRGKSPWGTRGPRAGREGSHPFPRPPCPWNEGFPSAGDTLFAFGLSSLGYSYQFVGLQRQAPTGMREAVPGCQARIARLLRAVHRLQKKMPEFQLRVAFRLGAGLRIDQLQFVAARELDLRSGLRAHRQPQLARGRGELWLKESPKAGAPLKLTRGDELK